MATPKRGSKRKRSYSDVRNQHQNHIGYSREPDVFRRLRLAVKDAKPYVREENAEAISNEVNKLKYYADKVATPKVKPSSRWFRVRVSSISMFSVLQVRDVVLERNNRAQKPNSHRASFPGAKAYFDWHRGLYIGGEDVCGWLFLGTGCSVRELWDFKKSERQYLYVLLRPDEDLPKELTGFNILRVTGYPCSKVTVIDRRKLIEIHDGDEVNFLRGELTDEGFKIAKEATRKHVGAITQRQLNAQPRAPLSDGGYWGSGLLYRPSVRRGKEEVLMSAFSAAERDQDLSGRKIDSVAADGVRRGRELESESKEESSMTKTQQADGAVYDGGEQNYDDVNDDETAPDGSCVSTSSELDEYEDYGDNIEDYLQHELNGEDDEENERPRKVRIVDPYDDKKRAVLLERAMLLLTQSTLSTSELEQFVNDLASTSPNQTESDGEAPTDPKGDNEGDEYGQDIAATEADVAITAAEGHGTLAPKGDMTKLQECFSKSKGFELQGDSTIGQPYQGASLNGPVRHTIPSCEDSSTHRESGVDAAEGTRSERPKMSDSDWQ